MTTWKSVCRDAVIGAVIGLALLGIGIASGILPPMISLDFESVSVAAMVCGR